MQTTGELEPIDQMMVQHIMLQVMKDLMLIKTIGADIYIDTKINDIAQSGKEIMSLIGINKMPKLAEFKLRMMYKGVIALVFNPDSLEDVLNDETTAAMAEEFGLVYVDGVVKEKTEVETKSNLVSALTMAPEERASKIASLMAEKTKLLNTYGVFGGGWAVNQQHDKINTQLQELGVTP